MGEYAGESIAKKVARVRLYKRVRQMFKAVGKDPSSAMVIFLPGPECCEAGALRHILKVPDENVLAIDQNSAAIDAAKTAMPGCSWVIGGLSEFHTLKFLETWTRPDFVHLDLMGTMSKTTALAYGQYGYILKPNGILAATFLRARELSAERDKLFWTKEMGDDLADRFKNRPDDKHDRGLAYIASADAERTWRHMYALLHYSDGWEAYIRFKGDTKKMHQWMFSEARLRHVTLRRNTGFDPICSYAYRGEFSPMGVVAAQKTRFVLSGSKTYRQQWLQKSRYVRSVIRKDSMIDLLREVAVLEGEGFDRRQIAEILHVKDGTVAAWKAHRTMGTYG